MYVKKIATNIIIVIIVVGCSFAAGCIYSSRDIKDLEGRLTESTALIEKQADRINIITIGLQDTTNENTILIGRVAELTSEAYRLKQQSQEYFNRLESITNGLPNDIEGLEGIVKGIDYFIGKSED